MTLRARACLLLLLCSWPVGPRASLAQPQERANEAQLQEAVRLAGAALADMEAGNFGRAEGALREVARILPDNVLPPVNLAICYFRLDRSVDALRQIDRAREIDPDNLQALFVQAQILGPEAAIDAEARAAWETTLERMIEIAPRDPRPYYLRGRALAQHAQYAAAIAAQRQGLERSPDNLVLMLDLLTSAAKSGDLETTIDALDAVEDRLNGFEGRAVEYADRLRDLQLAGSSDGVRPPALVIQNLLRPTDLYRIGIAELEGREAGLHLFPQLEFDPPLPKSVQGGQDIDIAFRDDSDAFGLESTLAGRSPSRLLHEHRRGIDALLVIAVTDGEPGLLRLAASDEGALEATAVTAPGLRDAAAISYDIDQDAVPDLVSAGGSGVVVHRGGADRTFAPGVGATSVTTEGVFPLDVDHDGDLDLFAARNGPDLYLQNNGGGGWSERAGELGMAGGDHHTSGIASADFDDDGDLDLAIAYRDRPLRLLINRRSGPFIDRSAAAGLEASAPASGLLAADFDNDRRFDLLSWTEGGSAQLLRNEGGAFVGWSLPAELGPVTALAAGDFDNDGDQDLAAVTATAQRRLLLLRNRRQESGLPQWTVEETGAQLPSPASRLLAGDYDRDGDLDLATLSDSHGVRLLRNLGGDRNQWLRLTLVGKNDSNSKNNTQGLFTTLETRSGGAYQAAIGNGGVNHIGLGARRQADVVRVVWTNGVSQTWQQLGSRQVLVEEQVLKGSCPFLYTWNGERFSFHTDLMWRSTLGMTFADGSPAPHHSARDWVLVPGETLAPAGSELWLMVTNELWETIYADRQSLLMIDHPAELELVIDETFASPPFPAEPPLHFFERLQPPARALDHRGVDVSVELSRRDGLHVGELPLTRYQGVTREHALELVFADVAFDRQLHLVLWGWIFPTDTSINFALAQDPTISVAPPRLEVFDHEGWRPLRESLGVPMGKRKAMVIALTGDFEASRLGTELRLRVVSSMEIYWDAAALATAAAHPQMVQRRLEPVAAELHYRGFSHLYRESASSPHLLDYSAVDVRPRFPPMVGAYTAYGEVTELLLAEDDRFVVMSPGDELALRYSAADLPQLPAGWRRDYVLYTDGWVKDADLHTAASQTVEPLPFHAMTSYPPKTRSPADLRKSLSRKLENGAFWEALRLQRDR